MATRAGVAASVAPRLWRNGAGRGPSGPAETTGYCGARRGDLRRRSRRGAPTTAATSSRASAAASASPSARRGGAPGRPPAVRWPNSASNTAASARRERPCGPASPRVAARRGQPPTPSTRTVTEPSSRPEQSLDGRRDGVPDLRGERHQALPGRATSQTARRRGHRAHGRAPARRARGRASGGPPRPTRRTPGTSRAARRTVSRITSVPTDSDAHVSQRSLPGRRPHPARRDDLPRASGMPSDSAICRVTWPRQSTAAASQAIPDHPPAGASVGDDAAPADAEQRRAAHDLVVERAPDPLDPRTHQEVGEPAAQVAAELTREQVEDVARQALEELDDDVAQDRVADDDVGKVRVEVLALDVADEVQVRLVDQLGRALDPRIALPLLLADATGAPPGGSGRRSTRSAKIAPMRAYWARFSAVESGLAPMSRSRNGREPVHLDGKRRPVDARQRAQDRDLPAAIPAPVWPAVTTASASPSPDELGGDQDRGLLLLARALAPGARPCR